MVPVKSMDIHCPHYIMPAASLDYNTTDMSMWDPPQVTSSVTNGISNSKKVFYI